ncbi:MAG: YopX family protein, partial [Muribaculaceae bacterium]|nr:YopX family protein [Muribaculaceae bacterium]
LSPCIHIAKKGYIRNGFYQIHPDTIGQFTGLKDENGKEIYEGDIISGCFKYDACDANGGVIPDQDCLCKGVVRFSELRLQWILDIFCSEYPVRRWVEENGDSEIPLVHFEYESPQFNMDLLEVIGTIHDNPDLISNQPTEV